MYKLRSSTPRVCARSHHYYHHQPVARARSRPNDRLASAHAPAPAHTHTQTVAACEQNHTGHILAATSKPNSTHPYPYPSAFSRQFRRLFVRVHHPDSSDSYTNQKRSPLQNHDCPPLRRHVVAGRRRCHLARRGIRFGLVACVHSV